MFNKLMDKILKYDLREQTIDVDKVVNEFTKQIKDKNVNVDQYKQNLIESVKNIVKNIKSVVNLYPDVKWDVLAKDIKRQYVAQFYDSQMSYLYNYHNNEIS